MNTAIELAEATDRVLLDQMVNGPIVRDAQGAVVFGPNGQPLREAPSAAMVNAALKRLAQLGISAVPTEGSGFIEMANAAATRARELRLGPLPPVDAESADAATG